MGYEPQFTITHRLLAQVEAVTSLRERILGATVELSWIPALQKDTRNRNAHASTAIEGNPLTLEQVRALEEGREPAASDGRSRREVLNYFAGLRFVETRFAWRLRAQRFQGGQAVREKRRHGLGEGWRICPPGGSRGRNVGRREHERCGGQFAGRSGSGDW